MRLLCPIWAVAVLPLVSTSCRNGRFDASAREQTDNVGKVVAAAECFCAQGGHYPGSLHELNGFHCEHPFARMDYDPTYFEWVNFTPQPDGRLDVRWKPKNGRGNGMGFIAVYPRAATQPANAPSTRPVLPIAATGPASITDGGFTGPISGASFNAFLRTAATQPHGEPDEWPVPIWNGLTEPSLIDKSQGWHRSLIDERQPRR